MRHACAFNNLVENNDFSVFQMIDIARDYHRVPTKLDASGSTEEMSDGNS